MIIACLSVLTGCSASSDGQVHELGDGTYSLGVPHSSLGDKTDALNGTIAKAGQYCHAMGQKLQIVPNSGGSDVRFRCAGMVESSSAPSAEDQEDH